MKIASKQEFMKLSERGLLGNRLRTWRTVEAVQAEHDGSVYIRGPVAGWKWMVPWCPVSDLASRVAVLERKSGTPRAQLQFVEVLPPGTPRTINAEAGYLAGGFTLHWGESSTLSLRHDLERNGRHHCGAVGRCIVRHRVPPEDVEMLDDLWHEWPGAIIEFSTYDRAVGIFNRQTVVWEVRHY